MSHSYSGWSLVKLKKERIKIDKAINAAEKRDKRATLAKMANIAKQNGFELHELISDLKTKDLPEKKTQTTPKSGRPRGKVAPKYRHPDDPAQTWTGRGRNPLWVKTSLDNGATLDDLRISAGVD